MIIHDEFAQGTPEWFAARRGIPTSSQFGRIVTAAKLQPSTQAKAYIDELVAEALIDQDCSRDVDSGWTLRGAEQEGQARLAYSFLQGVEVREVGFVTRDDGMVGCSPDGLVGDHGLLEIKVPSAANHVGYLRDPDSFVAKYRMQVQGQLWVCHPERQWCDLFSYNTEMDPVVMHCCPDPNVFAAFDEHVNAFIERLLLERERFGIARPAQIGEPT